MSVAEDSGGFAVHNTNDLAAGLERISRESRSYYLIGYVPKDVKPDGRFRKIEVKLGRSGLTVRARKGYFAPTAAEASGAPRTADLDPEVRKALDSPRDLADLPVRATALVFDQSGADAARVVIAADVDVNGFSFEPEAGFAAGRGGGVRGGGHASRDRSRLPLRPDRRDALEPRNQAAAGRDLVLDVP